MVIFCFNFVLQTRHDPKRLVDEIKISSNEETCATYNLLKVSTHLSSLITVRVTQNPELAWLQVSRNLFRWTKEAKYADHYERLLINGIMGNQRGTQPGVMLYFLPMGPGRSKSVSGRPPSGLPPMNPGGWGGPNDTFWCCYGTGNSSWTFTWLCSCSCWVLNLLVCIARDRVFLKARRFHLFPGRG